MKATNQDRSYGTLNDASASIKFSNVHKSSPFTISRVIRE